MNLPCARRSATSARRFVVWPSSLETGTIIVTVAVSFYAPLGPSRHAAFAASASEGRGQNGSFAALVDAQRAARGEGPLRFRPAET